MLESWRAGTTGWSAHLTFCLSVYRWQSEKRKGFLHEHPWYASSWSSKPMEALHRTGNRSEKPPKPTTNKMGNPTCRNKLRRLQPLATVSMSTQERQQAGARQRRSDTQLSCQQQCSKQFGVKRSEGISIGALGTGTGLHVDETDVDACWETREPTNDDGGKRGFCDVHTGVTLGPIAVGTARKESYSSPKVWVHGWSNHDLMQCDT